MLPNNPEKPPSDAQIPASLRNTITDPAATLAFIQTQIHAIYSAASTNDQDDKALTLDHDTYLKIYTAVFDFCTATKSPAVSLSGRDLYRCLEQESRAYCRVVQGKIFTADTDTKDDEPRRLSKAYVAQYDKFVQLSSLVKNLVQVLERHWIRREIDEKKKKVHLIGDLNKIVWREEVLEVNTNTTATVKGLGEVADAVTALRERDGQMTEYDLKLVKDVAKSLSHLGLTLDS